MVVEVVKNIKSVVVEMLPRYFDFKMFFLWSSLVIFLTIIIKIDSQNMLDYRFFYTIDEASLYIKALSRKDTYRYLLSEIFNIFIILTSTILLYLSLKRFYFKKKIIKYFAFIPGAFGLYEVVILISVLSDSVDIKTYFWLGWISILKWITLGTVLTFFVLGCIYRLKNKPKTS